MPGNPRVSFVPPSASIWQIGLEAPDGCITNASLRIRRLNFLTQPRNSPRSLPIVRHFVSMNTTPRVPTCSDSCQSRSIHLLLSLSFPFGAPFFAIFVRLAHRCFPIRTIVDRPWDIFYDGSRAFLLFRSNVSTEEPGSWMVELVAAG